MLDPCQVQRHPHAERGLDLYETPSVAVEALLRVEKILHRIWECAVGRGAPAPGFRARASDMLPDSVPIETPSANMLILYRYCRQKPPASAKKWFFDKYKSRIRRGTGALFSLVNPARGVR